MRGGWGGDHAGLHLCGPPPLILRRAQHERPCPARGFRIGVGNDGREWDGFQPGSGNGGSKRQVNGVGPRSLAGPRDDRGVGGGWGGNHAGLHLCGHPPAHTSRASARAAPPLGMASRHRRTYSAGPRDDMGGGRWVGRRSRGIAPTRAPPRSYFDGLSTSGPALGDGFTA